MVDNITHKHIWCDAISSTGYTKTGSKLPDTSGINQLMN